jgi:hypothetical protein
MRVNVYAEELPVERRVEAVSTIAETGRTFFGARIYLQSAAALHDRAGDDDRSAITFWGPRIRVAALLREAADVLSEHVNNDGCWELRDEIVKILVGTTFHVAGGVLDQWAGLQADEIMSHIRPLAQEVNRLRAWVDDLQAGMYINCVYCGHRYGPDDRVPATMAEALKEHIEQCPSHPMSALKAERDRLLQELADAQALVRWTGPSKP